MQNIRSLCVYCGSSGAVAAQYRDAANELGAELARAGIALVYGGGRVGLMGLLADAALAAEGKVTGIIPSHLRDAEVAHRGVTELIVVDSMHERKRLMAERADGLPGGIGTRLIRDRRRGRQLRLTSRFSVDIGCAKHPARSPTGSLAARCAEPGLQVVSASPALMAALSGSAGGWHGGCKTSLNWRT